MAASAVEVKLDKEKQLRDAAYKGNEDRVDSLINEGVNVNCIPLGENSSLRTPLHWAALAGHISIVLKLLAAGANPLARAKEKNQTPLDLAIQSGHTKICDELRKRIGVESHKISDFIGTLDKNKSNEHAVDIKKLKSQVASFRREIQNFYTNVNAKVQTYNHALSEDEVLSNVIDTLFKKKVPFLNLPPQELKQVEEVLRSFDFTSMVSRFARTIASIFETFDKQSNDNYFYPILIGFIVENIVLQRELPEKVEAIIASLKANIKQAKLANKLSKELRNKIIPYVTAQQSLLFEAFSRHFRFYIENPKGFSEFVSQYFPGTLIKAIYLVPFQTDSNGKQIPFVPTFDDLHKNSSIVFEQFKLYFENLRKTLFNLTQQEIEHIDRHVQIFTPNNSNEHESAQKHILNILDFSLNKQLEEIMRSHSSIEVLQLEVYNAYHQGQNIFEKFKELLKGLKTLPEAIVRQKYEAIRMEFLTKLEEQRANAPIDHATQLAKDSARSLEIKKDLDNKAREEAERLKAEAGALLLHQQKLDELKQKQEQEKLKLNLEKEHFKKQFLENLTSHDKKYIFELLNNPKQDLTEKEYLTLLKTLNIPGSESIDKNSISGNSGTFHAGSLYSFTYHSPHGRKGNCVDPANINHLIKLLESVGINKDNFEALTKVTNGAGAGPV